MQVTKKQYDEALVFVLTPTVYNAMKEGGVSPTSIHRTAALKIFEEDMRVYPYVDVIREAWRRLSKYGEYIWDDQLADALDVVCCSSCDQRDYCVAHGLCNYTGSKLVSNIEA